MNNLCFGMKVINITQLPGGSYSHPNQALDLAGSDAGIDFWFAQGRWKCVAGSWGYGTYFFIPVDENGNTTPVHCADGINRIVTLALTHSTQQYVSTVKGKIYKNGEPMYEEGMNGRYQNPAISGNHIHAEVADGIQTTKYKGSDGTYRMKNELNILDVMYVNKLFSTVSVLSKGRDRLKYCDKLEYDGVMNGWYKKDDKWYYYKNGTKLTGWQYLKWSGGKHWFYFDGDGIMLTGLKYLKWKDRYDWYYLDDKTGVMKTGEQTLVMKFSESGELTGGKKV